MKQLFTRGCLVLISMLATGAAIAQTGVNTITPDASAELDITSTTRGLLPPRMTALQRSAIVTPAAGLVVYDTDSAALMLYNGTAWARLRSGGGGTGWGLSGNTGNAPGSFLGTTDMQPIRLKVNNEQAGYIDPLSNVTSFGYSALANNQDSLNENTAFGISALSANTTGSDNTAMGPYAMYQNTTGYQNVAIGSEALRNNTGGSTNVAIGHLSLRDNLTGSGNVAVGHYALLDNKAHGNTAVGQQALRSNTTATANTAVGDGALQFNVTGSGNTGVGAFALRNNIVGNNTAVGDFAMYNNTTGASNTAVGNATLYANTVVGNLTAVGDSALSLNGIGAVPNSNDATNNTAIGSKALQHTTTGWNNTAAGYGALKNNVAGTYNSAYGVFSLVNNTADGNTALGTYSMNFNTTGSYNTAVGVNALVLNQTGLQNTALGHDVLSANTSGNYNTAIGDNGMPANTTGSKNTTLGYHANVGAANLTNATAIGAEAVVSASNSLVLGNNANVGIGNSSPSAKLDVAGNVKIADGTQGAGKVLTSDANGLASWQTPAAGGGGGGTSQWLNNVNDIYYGANSTNKVIVGWDAPIGSARFQVHDANAFGKGSRFVVASPYESAIFAADSGTSGGPKGCDVCGGNAAIEATSKYGDALFATSTNGRGIYLKGGSSFYPAMTIEKNSGASMPALDIAGSIKIADGTQGAGKVLTSDANGNASWQSGGGSGGGTSYNAGSGIQISPTNVISADDNSAINEIQALSLSGSTLSLSNGGGSVTLPSSGASGWVYQSGQSSVYQQDIYNGTVAIGTNNPSPDFKLNVFGGGKPNALYLSGSSQADYALQTIFGKVSIGAGTSTTEKLEVNGAIKIGNASATPANGTIRYTAATGFQGYHSGAWASLGGSVASSSNYAFKAKVNTSTPLSQTAYNQIGFDGEVFDAGNVYDPSTSLFTAPAAGIYHFDVKLNIYSSAVNEFSSAIEFVKNANTAVEDGLSIQSFNVPYPGTYTATQSLDIELAAGETIKVQARTVLHTGTATHTLGNFGPSVYTSSFSGHRIQ